MKQFRNDFSIYRNNKQITYLDYAATTFMPDNVIDAWNYYQMNIGVSLNRSSGILANKAAEIYENSVERIKKFFGAVNEYDIVFTKNATEGLNLLAETVGNNIKEGDIVLMSSYEHHSNILPWKKAVKEKKASIVLVPIDENGILDYEFINKIDISKVKVVSMSLVSNVNGYLIDLEKIIKFVQKSKAFFILDVSQAAGHFQMNFGEIEADAYVMSAHKMYGPKNVGACFIKKNCIERLPPFLLGGGMVWNTIGGNVEWHNGSRKYEAGTFDIGLVYAWSKACEYLDNIGMDVICKNDKEIFDFVKYKFHMMPNINVIHGGNDTSSICSFEITGIHPHDVSEILAEYQIEIRTGHMCAQNVLNFFGKTSLCRISWGVGSQIDDIEKLVNILKTKCEV